MPVAWVFIISLIFHLRIHISTLAYNKAKKKKSQQMLMAIFGYCLTDTYIFKAE